MFVAAQREVGDCVGAAWAERPPAMEPLVRMLLAADRYATAGLKFKYKYVKLTPVRVLCRAQREVGDCVGAAWAERPPAMEPLVRMLLAADRYAAAGLRAECLRRLAARFDRVELGSEQGLHLGSEAGARPGAPGPPRPRRAPRLPARDRRVFEAFLVAVAPTVRPNPCKPIVAI